MFKVYNDNTDGKTLTIKFEKNQAVVGTLPNPTTIVSKQNKEGELTEKMTLIDELASLLPDKTVYFMVSNSNEI